MRKLLNLRIVIFLFMSISGNDAFYCECPKRSKPEEDESPPELLTNHHPDQANQVKVPPAEGNLYSLKNLSDASSYFSKLTRII